MRRVPSRRPAGKDPIEPQIEAALQPGSWVDAHASGGCEFRFL